MSISGLFRSFGAPLANNRWSWGAQRDTDGAVFLRVWQDLKFIDSDGRIYMLIFGPEAKEPGTNLGYEERRRHTQAIRDGAPCFLVMCTSNDVDAKERTIDGFDATDVFVGGDLCKTGPDFTFPPKTSERAKFEAREGAVWIRLAGRKPVNGVAHR
jgi:hypothetical protein